MRYRTNVALAIKGDRVAKGTEIELSAEQAKRFDPADITPVDQIPEPEPEIALSSIPLDEMTYEQLKARAKELGLSASGSKADIQERIRLHVETPADGQAEEVEIEGEGSADGQAEDELSN